MHRGKYDYRLCIWADKHDKSENRPENEVDYDNRKENFTEINIFLTVEEIKKIVFNRIENLIEITQNRPVETLEIKKIPSQLKAKVTENLNLDKLEELIRNKERGGLFIENGRKHWGGFGLKRILLYIEYRSNISENVREHMKIIISQRLT